MPKSKKRKKHSQKLKARNQKIEQSKAQAKKLQQRFLEDLIKKEQEAGKFKDNTVVGNSDITEEIQGPEI